VTDAGEARTPREAIQRPIACSLCPPPYASAVSKWVMPACQAASMSASAWSSVRPLPKNSGAEPIPPKLPQPSAILGIVRAERPSGRSPTSVALIPGCRR